MLICYLCIFFPGVCSYLLPILMGLFFILLIFKNSLYILGTSFFFIRYVFYFLILTKGYFLKSLIERRWGGEREKKHQCEREMLQPAEPYRWGPRYMFANSFSQSVACVLILSSVFSEQKVFILIKNNLPIFFHGSCFGIVFRNSSPKPGPSRLSFIFASMLYFLP